METEISCPSCSNQFNVEHDGRSGVAACPYCGAAIKLENPRKERVIPHGAPARPGAEEIHHLPSHANLPVSHKKVPKLEEPKPRVSIMDMVFWLLLIGTVIGLAGWWFNRPSPPAKTETPAPAAAHAPAQPAPMPPPVAAKEFIEVTLTNPGLEKALEGWKIVQAAGLVRAMTDAAHSGKRGLRVADDSAERNTVVSCAFPFVPGDAYECRFWARIVSGNGATVSLQFINAEGLAIENSVEIPAVAKQWKEFTIKATAPSQAVKAEISIATTGEGTALADFDDFQLFHAR